MLKNTVHLINAPIKSNGDFKNFSIGIQKWPLNSETIMIFHKWQKYGQIKNRCVSGNGSGNFRKCRHPYFCNYFLFWKKKNSIYAFWKVVHLSKYIKSYSIQKTWKNLGFTSKFRYGWVTLNTSIFNLAYAIFLIHLIISIYYTQWYMKTKYNQFQNVMTNCCNWECRKQRNEIKIYHNQV